MGIHLCVEKSTKVSDVSPLPSRLSDTSRIQSTGSHTLADGRRRQPALLLFVARHRPVATDGGLFVIVVEGAGGVVGQSGFDSSIAALNEQHTMKK